MNTIQITQHTTTIGNLIFHTEERARKALPLLQRQNKNPKEKCHRKFKEAVDEIPAQCKGGRKGCMQSSVLQSKLKTQFIESVSSR
ncbi:hypothetical protein SLEP1_g57624 [Rubroshorea leprosula]|uniref:Uncharacterized protein n=1 Tax=Rubroshorea leprosula TaxID=152421 RepID=A0AAV5MQT6_9ROSI|nr:hypothetical protein SLEP1_g57624 [Rubroshorea leprosula]